MPLDLLYLLFFGYFVSGLLIFLFLPLRKRPLRIIMGFSFLPVFFGCCFGTFVILEEAFPGLSELCLDQPDFVCHTNLTAVYLSIFSGLLVCGSYYYFLRKRDQQH